MIKSMTGYGRAEKNYEGVKWSAELKTVNHRFLDISIKLPRALNLLEEKIKNMIKESIGRGKVELYIKFQNDSLEGRYVKLDKQLVKAYYSCLEEISEFEGINKEIGIMDLASLPEVFVIEEPEHDLDLYWQQLQGIIAEALMQLTEMRLLEGQKLYEDLYSKIVLIEGYCVYLEENSEEIIKEYKEKLTKKIQIATESIEVDVTRVITEVAILADKSCIDEEIVRIKSHLFQMEKDLLSNTAVGRKLDFLIQELNREINTIGSKSNSYLISSKVIEIKSIIEQMREQVQNIE